MVTRIEQLQQFGPCKGHYRVVRSVPVTLSYDTAIAIVQRINDRLGVAREGKRIFPRVGQKYFTIRRTYHANQNSEG